MTTDRDEGPAVGECRCGGKEHIVCLPKRAWSRVVRHELSAWSTAWRWATQCAKKHPPNAYQLTPWDPAHHRERRRGHHGPCWSCGQETDYGQPDVASRPEDEAVTIVVERWSRGTVEAVPLCWMCHIQPTPERRAALLERWSALLAARDAKAAHQP